MPDRIQQVLADQQTAKAIRKHLDHLDHQLRLARLDLERLAALQEKEYMDFEALNKFNLKGIFHTVLGSRAEQLNKEKQEYLSACLQYNEVQKTLELLQFEKSVLTEKLDKFKHVDQEITQLLNERERQLLNSGTDEGKALLEAINDIDRVMYRQREINEAASVGEQADQLLNEISDYLKKAEGWGDWVRNTNPQMQDYIRHSYVDKARERAHHASHLLNCFSKELMDVYGTEQIKELWLTNVLNDFHRFTHDFIQNLISDWVSEQKIKYTLGNVSAIRKSLYFLLQALYVQQDELLAACQELEARKQSIIKP